jgi:hypothetical protein
LRAVALRAVLRLFDAALRRPVDRLRVVIHFPL